MSNRRGVNTRAYGAGNEDETTHVNKFSGRAASSFDDSTAEEANENARDTLLSNFATAELEYEIRHKEISHAIQDSIKIGPDAKDQTNKLWKSLRP
jgi:hypothetical protein